MAKTKNKTLAIIMGVAITVVLIVLVIMVYKTITAPVPVSAPSELPSTSDTSGLPVQADANLVGIYEGTLPCADCPGILTTLALITDDPAADADAATGTYEEIMMYEDSDAPPSISAGHYVTQAGTDDQGNKTIIYTLTDSQTNEVEYWQTFTDGLEKLDENGQVIESALPMILNLKIKGPANQN